METQWSTLYAADLHILRYTKSTLFHGLYFPACSSSELRAYSDVNWADDFTDRWSTTDQCILLGDSLISWKCKTVIARSSTKAEYRALTNITQKIIWLRWLLTDMGIFFSHSIPLFYDNCSAIQITCNDVFYERTKYIEADCHFIRQHSIQRLITLHFISSSNQPDDIFIKSHPPVRFHELVSKLMLVPTKPSWVWKRGGKEGDSINVFNVISWKYVRW